MVISFLLKVSFLVSSVQIDHDVVKQGSQRGKGCNDIGVSRPFQSIESISLCLIIRDPRIAQPD